MVLALACPAAPRLRAYAGVARPGDQGTLVAASTASATRLARRRGFAAVMARPPPTLPPPGQGEGASGAAAP